MSQNPSLPPEDDFARALLRSAEADEPSHAAYARVAAALGVSTAVGMASLSAPAALAAGSSGLLRWSGSLAGKLALLGVSGALLVGGGRALLRHGFSGSLAGMRGVHGGVSPVLPPAQVEPSAPKAAPVPAGAANAVVASAPSDAVSKTTALEATAAANAGPMDADAEAAILRPARAAVHPGLLNPRAARSSSGAALSNSSGSLRAAGSSLPEQVQSLDRARVALGSGDASAALVEIAHYRKAWPKGVFLTEASVLEIEALAKRGERSLAAARAQAFVAAHPDSPQAERLRALIPVSAAVPASEQF
ncbi:MAG: hypothetical protein ABI488_24480 [Polyangiaceae bacterium]